MFVLFIDSRGNKYYYTKRSDGYWWRWYENETHRPEFWELVPWCGY